MKPRARVRGDERGWPGALGNPASANAIGGPIEGDSRHHNNHMYGSRWVAGDRRLALAWLL